MKTYDILAFSQAYSTAPRAMYVELVYGFYSLFLILFTYCGTGIWFLFTVFKRGTSLQHSCMENLYGSERDDDGNRDSRTQ